jgi:phage tail-like protein
MATTINPLSNLITDPVRNFKFLVKFTPVDIGSDKNSDAYWGDAQKSGTMGFVSLSGLSTTIESIAYREGGYNTNVHQIPGQAAFTPIQMTKGVLLGTPENWRWIKRLFSVLTPGTGVGGGVGGQFRCHIDIAVLSHPNPQGNPGSGEVTGANATPWDQHVSMSFRIYNAWITSLTYGNLDAGANSLMVEELTFVHEGFDVQYATGYAKDASAALFIK